MQEFQWLIICIGLVFLIFILLVLPITIKIKLYANLEDMHAFYSVKILGIKLLCGMSKIEGKKLMFFNTHNKIIKPSKEEQKKEGLFLKQIAKNINTHKLDLIFNFGLNDAGLSAIICGYVQMIFCFLCSHVLVFNRYSHVFEGVTTNFQTEKCELTLQLVLGINIIKIIKSKIIANKIHMENVYGK